jgi:hypothetical protein
MTAQSETTNSEPLFIPTQQLVRPAFASVDADQAPPIAGAPEHGRERLMAAFAVRKQE